MKNYIIISLLLIVLSINFSCNESFPSRIIPNNVIVLKHVSANYGRFAQSYILFAITGENIYEETLQDTLAVDGRINIWSKKRAEFKANVPLTYLGGNYDERFPNQTLFTLDPEEVFYIQIKWFGQSTDGRNIFDLLEFPDDRIKDNMSYSIPETLYYDIHLKIFDQPNMEMYIESDLVFESWKQVE